jgi:hypothetical protein
MISWHGTGGLLRRRAARSQVSSAGEPKPRRIAWPINLATGGAAMPDVPRDVLSQGGDRDPRPWPRRLAVLAVLAVVVVVVVVHFRPHGSPSRHHPAASHVSQVPVAGPGAGPFPPGVGVGGPAADRGGPAVPDGIIGPTLRWGAAQRVPLTGEQPAWFSPGTGRVERIAGLPASKSGYQFARTAAGWTIQAGSAVPPPCAGCAGLPQPVYFLGDHAQSVRPVGAADQSAPGATPGVLWLTSFRPGADLSTAMATAQEVTVGGRMIGHPLRLPAGQVIDQATDRGLLLAPATSGPAPTMLRLWDPASRHFGRAYTRVIAAGPREVAWTSQCAPTCRIHLQNLATGAEQIISLPAGHSVASGSFSQDGGFLALQVTFNSSDDSASAVELEVASAATGRLTVVPGTFASSDALVSFGWPSSADRLVTELSFTTKVQVAAWRPGASKIAVAVVAAGRLPAAVVTG